MSKYCSGYLAAILVVLSAAVPVRAEADLKLPRESVTLRPAGNHCIRNLARMNLTNIGVRRRPGQGLFYISLSSLPPRCPVRRRVAPVPHQFFIVCRARFRRSFDEMPSPTSLAR